MHWKKYHWNYQRKSFGAAAGAEDKIFRKIYLGDESLKKKLEERRRQELKFHREQKMKLLSLTHDIKTPLSVIKLNAQALEKGLYQDSEKEAAGSREYLSGKQWR